MKLTKKAWESIGKQAGWMGDTRCPECGDKLSKWREDEGPECPCGWWPNAERCEQCEQFFNSNDIEDGLCPNCSEKI